MTNDKKYFNVRIEFDKDKLDKTIFDAIEKGIPGYSCSVESNNLTVANQNPEFLEVLNGALKTAKEKKRRGMLQKHTNALKATAFRYALSLKERLCICLRVATRNISKT